MFRPAGFTPPPRLNAASELRLSDLAAESRPARHRPFHERNALAEGQKNAKKYAERNIRRQRRVEVQGLFSPMESPLRIPSLLPPLPPLAISNLPRPDNTASRFRKCLSHEKMLVLQAAPLAL